jgi:hypothetical protein
MFTKYLAGFIAVIFMINGGSPFLYAQTKANKSISNAEKVKAQVLTRGISEKKCVRVKMSNGTKMKGYISQIGDDSFTLTDSKSNKTTVIAYRDAAQVEKRGLSGGAKIGLIVVAGLAVTVAILFFVIRDAVHDAL